MTITKGMIEDVINDLGNDFDSHKVILQLAHDNQRAYIDTLHAIDSETPFHTLHSKLGVEIKEICLELGFTRNESCSLDIFGQQSKCLSWSK